MTDQPTPAQLREAADILAAACDDRDVNWATPDDLREWAQRQEEEAARRRCSDVLTVPTSTHSLRRLRLQPAASHHGPAGWLVLG